MTNDDIKEAARLVGEIEKLESVRRQAQNIYHEGFDVCPVGHSEVTLLEINRSEVFDLVDYRLSAKKRRIAELTGC